MNRRFTYILWAYLIGIAIFTVFRLIETAVFVGMSAQAVDFEGLYPKALFMGWRFDTVVCCYFLTLPLLMMAIGEIARIRSRGYYLVAHYITVILFIIGFFACAADIPYFCYFYSRLDVVALSWVDSFGVMMSMIFTEPAYVIYLVAFIAVAVGYWFLMRWLFRRQFKDLQRDKDGGEGNIRFLPRSWAIVLTVVLALATFAGMRGRLVAKSPIRTGTASFCTNPFLNQIGLNPVFTFIKSLEEAGKERNKPVDLIDIDIARSVLAEQQGAVSDSSIISSLLLPKGTNVVIVLMESMAADKTGISDPTKSLTPHLDSLMAAGMIYNWAWSAGIHTYNGIYSTLYSHPAILSKHPMKQANIPRLEGIPQILADAGYSTAYFMTHDEDVDNMRGFLYNNGFQHVVGQHSYPKNEVVGTWGIPDHTLFDHIVEHCDSASANGPFFVCAMTCSDHAPYIIPDGIDASFHSDDLTKRIVEYADWAIGRFMRQASSRPWFENTLFVFVADHGASFDHTYDMSLAYNHVPLLFYSPKHIAPQRIEHLAQQIDIAPTILGMLGMKDSNCGIGVDLQRHKRRYAYFSADKYIGIVDDSLLCLYRHNDRSTSLYRYRDADTTDLAKQRPETVADMKRFGLGMTQISQEIINRH